VKKTMKKTIFLLLLLSSILSGGRACHPGDQDALLAIKASLGDPKLLASWTPEASCCDEDWQHVECDDDTGRVISLSVILEEEDGDDDGSSLAGTIPDAVAGLDHLENLDLRRLPGISGPIPAAIARLSNLAFLTISRTAVSGPVPSFLGELTALTELDLSYNSLSGSIPASLSGLPNLWSVDVRHNLLSGTLPPLLFSNNKQQQQDDDDESYGYLVDLRLSHNRLSGSIPREWSAVSFGVVSLSRNALSGDASPLFGRDKPLQLLDLSRNGFSFNLSAVDLPEQLGVMDLSHNAIYGGVPAQAAGLQFLNVSYNLLCGEVPGNVASLFDDAYSFQNNTCLCGALLQPFFFCEEPLLQPC
jgi:hypothetical protein